jgi:hypothetical protein
MILIDRGRGTLPHKVFVPKSAPVHLPTPVII